MKKRIQKKIEKKRTENWFKEKQKKIEEKRAENWLKGNQKNIVQAVLNAEGQIRQNAEAMTDGSSGDEDREYQDGLETACKAVLPQIIEREMRQSLDKIPEIAKEAKDIANEKLGEFTDLMQKRNRI
jgi:hypothetical protein